MDNRKLNDFWINEDFWSKSNEKQLKLDEVKYSRVRLREVKRDFKVINQAQQWEKKLFFKVLDYALQTMNIPNGYKGTGRPSIPIQDKIKICCIKQYNLKGARRSVYDVEFARNLKYVFIPEISANYFNRINDYMKDESLTPYLQELIRTLSEPFVNLEHYFAVDGTGFKISTGKSNYRAIRTDKKERRTYIGLHAICGIKSKIIPYAIISKGYAHDSQFFKPLVLETAKIFDIKEIYADSAFLNRSAVELCQSMNIKFYSPPKSNTIFNETGNSSWDNSIRRYLKDMNLGKERRYTLRNSVENSFMMIKMIFSDFLRHKTFSGRINELLCRVICHNVRCLIYAYFKEEIKFPFSE